MHASCRHDAVASLPCHGDGCLDTLVHLRLPRAALIADASHPTPGRESFCTNWHNTSNEEHAVISVPSLPLARP